MSAGTLLKIFSKTRHKILLALKSESFLSMLSTIQCQALRNKLFPRKITTSGFFLNFYAEKKDQSFIFACKSAALSLYRTSFTIKPVSVCNFVWNHACRAVNSVNVLFILIVLLYNTLKFVTYFSQTKPFPIAIFYYTSKSS